MTKRSRIMIIGLVVIVVGLLWLQTPLMKNIRGAAWTGWVGFVGAVGQVGPLAVPNNVTEQMGTLVAENARLKAECRDYQDIMNQLGSNTAEDFVPVKARVAAEPIDTFHAQLILNKGAQDGIVLGAPVVIQDSVLVGFISQLFDHSAVMRLVFSPESTLPAEVLSDEATGKGLVRGKSYTSVEMVTIPRDVVIEPGQDVVTAAQEGLVPYGLLIGQVEQTQDEQYEPYQRARLEVSYDAARLKAVTVLIAP